MSVKSVSSRYAKSLLELAEENNVLEQVREDILSFKKLIKHRELWVMLKSPVVPSDKKIKVIDKLLADNYQELTVKFIRLVIKKEREELLPYIADEFIEQYRQVKNIAAVKLISAAPLSDEAIQKIKDKLHKEKMVDGEIELVQRIDKDLIGGFVLEFGEYRYDASVAWKLNDLRKSNYANNPYESKFRAR